MCGVTRRADSCVFLEGAAFLMAGDLVTAQDILERLETSVGPVADRESALYRLAHYVQWLSGWRLGSVFEAAYDKEGVLAARKVSDLPPVVRTPLPD